MKSFFKRTLAAASGSILALSQLSAAAATVNVNAVDEASAASSKTTVDKEFVLFVPIDEENPLNGLHSDWNDKVEAALLASGDKTFTVAPDLGKEKAKKIMLKSGQIDSATADDILAALSDVTVNVKSDGKVTAEVKMSNIGPTIGQLAEDELAKHGHPSIDNDDKPREIVWSSFKAYGSLIIDGKLDFDAKTFEYEITLIDENGTAYKGDKGLEEYATKKANEAYELVFSQRLEGDKYEKTNKRMAEAKQYVADKLSVVRTIADTIADVTVSGSSLDAVYSEYVQKIEDASKSAKVKDIIEENKPATVSQFWTDERVTESYDKAVEIINTNFGDYVDVQLKLSDIKDITESATEAEYKIEGYSAQAILTIPDDKEAEVKAAVEKYCAENNAKLVSFSSSKKITAKADTEYGMKGSAFYDVERIIKAETEPITTTTTAPVVTTSDESTTTTTVPVSETTVPVTETTEPVSETTAPVTDVTTTVPDPTTTPATYVSFEFEGIEDEGLVYWSEEDGEFDLSNLSVSMHFYEAGIEQPSKTVEVTDAFTPEAKKPSDLTMPKSIGCAAKTVYFKLTDEAAVQQAIKDAGYDDALIEQEGIKNGKEAGKFTVYLVLRGDTDLSGHVDVIDAQLALIYYTHTAVALKDADKVFEETIYLKSQGEYEKAYFPYSHYAMDVWDGNGIISVEDAQGILKYYTQIDVALKEGITWDSKEVVGKKIVPLDELHKEPLARDTYASKYVGMRNPLKEEG